MTRGKTLRTKQPYLMRPSNAPCAWTSALALSRCPTVSWLNVIQILTVLLLFCDWHLPSVSLHWLCSQAPCQHNFCLGCFNKWVAQGKKTCPTCRHAFPAKFASNPRINTLLASAIRMAKLGQRPVNTKIAVVCPPQPSPIASHPPVFIRWTFAHLSILEPRSAILSGEINNLWLCVAAAHQRQGQAGRGVHYRPRSALGARQRRLRPHHGHRPRRPLRAHPSRGRSSRHGDDPLYICSACANMPLAACLLSCSLWASTSGVQSQQP